MKILIADDSQVSRRLLTATLEKWGYHPIPACDGAEALAKLQSGDAPQLAILDWMMPIHTGPEVCRRIRHAARENYTYIILLTSRSQKQDLIEGMDAGADDYLTKPFDRHELKVRLRAGHRIIKLQEELLNAREALRAQATQDSLTGLWNRYSVLEILQKELDRSRREGNCVGLVLLDIDHFKRINDTYGHLAGDQVLRETARRMESATRSYDAVGRYGGEEFLIVVASTSEEGVMHQAERLRHGIADAPMPVGNTGITVTASLGATVARGSDTLSIEAMIRAADEALYEAKRCGRNRSAFRSVTDESPRILSLPDAVPAGY